jgi:uncharacterized protein (TIGR03437 family)
MQPDRRRIGKSLKAGFVLVLGVAGGLAYGGIGISVGNLNTAELYEPAILQSPPVLLSISGGGQSQGAILHADTHQLVSSSNPARTGDALEIYGTGLIEASVVPPQVAIGGRIFEIVFFGKAPGFAGLNQVNIRVPVGIVPGPAIPVRLSYIGRPSNEVMIAVQ